MINTPKIIMSGDGYRLVLVKTGETETGRSPIHNTVIERRTRDAMGGEIWTETSRFVDSHALTVMSVASEEGRSK